MCEQIGSTLGMVEQAEDVDEGTHKRSFMRVRVELDIRAPLCKGRKVVMGDQDYWVSFKYEQLPNFCYWCGLLTHDEKECELWIRSKGSLLAADQQYGTWLRGDSDRYFRKPQRSFDMNRQGQRFKTADRKYGDTERHSSPAHTTPGRTNPIEKKEAQHS